MKNLACKLMALALFVSTSNTQAQSIFKKLKDKLTDQTNQKTDAAANTIVNAPDNALKGSTPSTATPAQGTNVATNTPMVMDIKTYANYDFVPGDTVIFEDHFTDDQDGEFPSHWDLKSGQAVLNKIGGEPAFCLTDGNYCRVLPLMKKPAYLSENFTLEYDVYGNEAYPAKFFFYDEPNYDGDNSVGISVDKSGCGYTIGGSNALSAPLPADIAESNFTNKWHHVAIAYKKQQIKVYVDQYRVLVVPHAALAPVHFEIAGLGDQKNPIILKNIRVANGGNMNMLGKKFTDLKLITHGINFDVDKATIKPESMGTLNMIVGVLKDNPDVKFVIGGHTDNSGTPSHNLILSQQRADAVKAQLLTMGVADSRLIAKGFGDTKPIADNSTMEGKAQNRRVEFVKF